MAAERLVDHCHRQPRGGRPFVGVNSFSKERPPTLNTDNFSSAQSGAALNDPGSPSRLDAPARPSAPAASTSTPALTTASSRETPSHNNADTTEPLNRGLHLLGPENPSAAGEQYHEPRPQLCAKCFTEITLDVHDGVADISYALNRYIAATSPDERSYHFRGLFADVGEQSGSIRGPCYIGPGTTSMHAEKTNSMPSSRTSLMAVGGDMAGLIAGSGEWAETDVWVMQWPATIDDAALVGEYEEAVL
jgi:hypothetical protein